VARVIEKFTTAFVSPTLWASEVLRIQESRATFDNMTIKVRPTVREVVATYTIDEGSTELVMILPPNYPYSDVEIESTKRVGVSAETWKKWMLQLRTFLLVSIRNACIYIFFEVT